MESKFVLFVVLAITAQSSPAVVDHHAELQALKETASSEFKQLIADLFDRIQNDLIHATSGNNSVTENDALAIEIAKNKTFDNMSNGWAAVLRGLVVIWPQASSEVDAFMAEVRPRLRTETIGRIHAGHELTKKSASAEIRAQIRTVEAEGLRAALDINTRTFDLIAKYAIGLPNITAAAIHIANQETGEITKSVYRTPYTAIHAVLDFKLSGGQVSIQDTLAVITQAHEQADACVDNFVRIVFTLYDLLYRFKPAAVIESVKNLPFLI